MNVYAQKFVTYTNKQLKKKKKHKDLLSIVGSVSVWLKKKKKGKQDIFIAYNWKSQH